MRGVHHSGSELSEAVRGFLRHHYVERQIYLRSHGQVQFISLSPFTQAVFLFVGFVIFSWVAFSSVDVLFNDGDSTVRDQRLVKMQSAYEAQMAHIQTAYDELNGKLVISQERFLATTRDLENKHRQLTALMSQRQATNSELDAMRKRYAATTRVLSDDENKGDMPAETRARDATPPTEQNESAVARLPLSSQVDARLTQLDHEQQSLINSVAATTEKRIGELSAILRMTDVIDVKTLVKDKGSDAKKSGAGKAEGGPFLRLSAGEAMAGKGNAQAFSAQFSKVSRNLQTLSELEKSIAKMPLAEPVDGWHETSGFGPRRDPFNGRLAFHAGMDLATDAGAPVYATAPGVVTYADWKGAYGRLVEVDMGNGFVTRYGHMSAINVKVGQKISFRDIVGRVGSTGRSSGPHLHYEVWFDGIVRDPSKFIEAGHYVFAKQG